MIKIKDLGNFEKVPQIVLDIIEENIQELDNYIQQGWDIEKSIEIDEYIDETPLTLALTMESFESVKWLIEHNVNLNSKNNPSFLKAVRYCDKDIIEYIVKNGAKVDLLNNVKSDAFKEVLYGGKTKNLQLVHDLGYTVDKHGGMAFRKVVSDQNYELVDFFIKNNVNINYNEPDMVYPFKPPPLCVAARYVDLKMCKYLVKHGADVTIAEKDGMRPYHIALEKNNLDMANYFKSIEPERFHCLESILGDLKPFNIPTELVNFLSSDNLRLELPDSDFEFFEFFSISYTF